MVDELDKLNIKLMVSVWPQIDLKSENFNEMRERGLLVHTERGVNVQMRFGGESVFFDATNPEARNYVWQKCKKIIMTRGYVFSGLMRLNLNIRSMILTIIVTLWEQPAR
jgi:alpha-glucosidase (family GH31 glycosyl hydrolase)